MLLRPNCYLPFCLSAHFLVAVFVRSLDGSFQADLIAARGGLHEGVMHEQPGHDVVFAYLILGLTDEAVGLKSRLLFGALM